MKYWKFEPAEQKSILVLNKVISEEVNDVFDISKIYQGVYEIDMFSGQPITPKVSTSITETEQDCEDCDGCGNVEITDTIGKYIYGADCECKNCDGIGKIELKEPLIVETIEDIKFNYSGIEFTLRYSSARFFFEKHGTPCRYEDRHIIFTEN